MSCCKHRPYVCNVSDNQGSSQTTLGENRAPCDSSLAEYSSASPRKKRRLRRRKCKLACCTLMLPGLTSSALVRSGRTGKIPQRTCAKAAKEPEIASEVYVTGPLSRGAWLHHSARHGWPETEVRCPRFGGLASGVWPVWAPAPSGLSLPFSPSAMPISVANPAQTAGEKPKAVSKCSYCPMVRLSTLASRFLDPDLFCSHRLSKSSSMPSATSVPVRFSASLRVHAPFLTCPRLFQILSTVLTLALSVKRALRASESTTPHTCAWDICKFFFFAETHSIDMDAFIRVTTLLLVWAPPHRVASDVAAPRLPNLSTNLPLPTRIPHYQAANPKLSRRSSHLIADSAPATSASRTSPWPLSDSLSPSTHRPASAPHTGLIDTTLIRLARCRHSPCRTQTSRRPPRRRRTGAFRAVLSTISAFRLPTLRRSAFQTPSISLTLSAPPGRPSLCPAPAQHRSLAPSNPRPFSTLPICRPRLLSIPLHHSSGQARRHRQSSARRQFIPTNLTLPPISTMHRPTRTRGPKTVTARSLLVPRPRSPRLSTHNPTQAGPCPISVVFLVSHPLQPRRLHR
jgi:hypothetical protein